VTVSFIVRLVPDALAQARIVGHVTVIATGAEAPVRSADDLIAFLLASAPATPDPAAPDSGPPQRPDSGHSGRRVRGVDAPEDA
jgi:hypothetical protein